MATEPSLECGLKFPTTLNAFEAAASGKADRKGWLVKTRHSCGGLGVRWYQSETILNAKSPEAVSLSTLTNENSQNQGIEKTHGMTQAEPVILQRWVPGRTYGATLLSTVIAVCWRADLFSPEWEICCLFIADPSGLSRLARPETPTGKSRPQADAGNITSWLIEYRSCDQSAR